MRWFIESYQVGANESSPYALPNSLVLKMPLKVGRLSGEFSQGSISGFQAKIRTSELADSSYWNADLKRSNYNHCLFRLKNVSDIIICLT